MEVLEQIEQVLTRAESMHVMFITDMDATDLRNHVASFGWGYVYINISSSDDAKNTLVRAIYNNCMKGMVSQPITDCDEYEVFDYLNNCEKKYVVHLHPTEELLNQPQLVAWLNTIDINKNYSNVRVIVLAKRNVNWKNHECFSIFKKKYLELRERKEIVSVLYGNYNLRDSNVVSSIRNITDKYENEVNEPIGDEYVSVFIDKNVRRVIALVDSKYLYSIECMYKTACAIEYGNPKESLYPIILDKSNHLDILQAEVFSFWAERLSKIEKCIEQLPDSSQSSMSFEKKCVSKIKDKLDEIWNIITSEEVYTDSNFERDLEFFINGEPNRNNIFANINKNIDPMEKNTKPEIIINGGNTQVNINAGSGPMTINNNQYFNTEITIEEVISELFDREFIDIYSVRVDTDEAVYEEVMKICSTFKDIVEHNRMSDLFHRQGRKPDETDWQLLLFAIAKAYEKASNGDYHVSREDNPGPGEIDMHFTCGIQANVCVEMKVSGSSELVHGYKEQLKGYMQAEKAKQGLYIIVKQDELHQSEIEKVKQLAESYAQSGDWYAPPVMVVDGRKQLSASKYNYTVPTE